MDYKFLAHTQRHRKGAIVELDSNAVATKQLVDRRIIEPYSHPADTRETKVIEPAETKKPRVSKKKVVIDDE